MPFVVLTPPADPCPKAADDLVDDRALPVNAYGLVVARVNVAREGFRVTGSLR